MKAFTTPLLSLREYEELKTKLKSNRGLLQAAGCVDSQKSQFIYGLSEGFSRRLIITYSDLKAKELYEEYRFFDRNVLLYPAKDLIFYQADIRGNLLTAQRMEVLKALLEDEEVTVIATFDGCMDHLLPLSVLSGSILEFSDGESLDLSDVEKQLVQLGYERNHQVEAKGQYAVRGGILDIFSLTEENPVRIELWGDEIDSIRSFDLESQRSIENLNRVRVYPATEMLFCDEELSRGLERIEKEEKQYEEALRAQKKPEAANRIAALIKSLKEEIEELPAQAPLESFVSYFTQKTVSFLDYISAENSVIFLDEPSRLIEKGRVVEKEFGESMAGRMEKGYMLPGQANILYCCEEVAARLNRRNCLSLCTLEHRLVNFQINATYHLTVKQVNPYNNSFELLTKDLKRYQKEGYRVLLLCASSTRAGRLAEDLRDFELNSFYTEDLNRIVSPGEIMVCKGNIRKGFEYPFIKFVVISEGDIFGREKKKKKKHKLYEGQKIQSFSELKVGDYIVHEEHGLGIYRGIEKVEVEKVTKDYMKIEYAGGSNLYILATQLDKIQKYAGADARAPRLNRLGTQEWKKTKSRVRGAVREIAGDLVKLYAARQEKEGYVYGPDTVWQREFEELFPFEETQDQQLAIEAVKKDMESRKIMDRLICGDVGYGKTEIAIRAAFKAAQENKQVVYLVPTTVLAQQHYNTFTQRMKNYPVRIDLLCRFRTPAQQKKTLEDLKKGFVDIVIGTHRVLSKDVEYKDLGLLIIDEEQRFGVTHKEKIKRLKENVDVITLTATPIPRTLHMSLIGIRDMSVLEEAPQDRVPIQTYVMEYNEEMVREAIVRELARGGQVYYVYNRVNTIDEMTAAIARLVPEANVAYAHGQLRERQLEKIMFGFINGEIDVLVSTTIIETGLDISNVNTMIIHDADNMGLSQLYQLRGRVGRSNRTAYAFLMYRRNKMLQEVAEKRLHAIREFTELGSGFKIAMRDLELRGAGNLLGAEQHGHMEAVGYDLYCKMLGEAVKEVKGEKPVEDFETSVELEMDAYIPSSYIGSEAQKLDIYKRVAGIENEEESRDMLEELIDRFGDPPKAVEDLLAISTLRNLAHSVYVKEITEKGDSIRFVLYERARINPAGIPAMVAFYGDSLKFSVGENPYFTYREAAKSRTRSAPDTLTVVKNVLNDIKRLLD